MKIKLYAFARNLISSSLLKVTITTFLTLAIQNICLGQVYSYTDVSAGEDDVMGYSAVTGYYNGSTHVYNTNTTMYSPTGRTSSISNSGTSATVYLSINEESGIFYVSTNYTGTCPNPYGGGGNHTVGGSGGSVQVTECMVCQGERTKKKILCYGVASSCEAAFLIAYNTAMTNCENNNYCNQNSPQYNQEQCDNCKSTAQQNFIIGTASCATALGVCLAISPPDCSLKDTGGQGTCENN